MRIEKQVSLNLNIRGLEQSATIRINDTSRQMIKQGKMVYRLGLGQSPFPVPKQIVESLRQNAHEKDYLPAKGHPQLREAVAEYHRRRDQVSVTGNNVIVGPGSKELMFLLQMVYYGELMVPTPCWVSYVPQAQIIGRTVSLIHTNFEDKWRIAPDRLEEHCEKEEDTYRPRILILNYPGNPEGCTYTAKELEEIASVARKYQLILLSDEIYGQLNHKGEHISVARYYPEGTIISSGLSKWCGAGGWRLGTFTFPDELAWLLEALAVAASETYTSVSAPIQYAAVTAFKGSTEIERYLWHSRRILARLGQECHQLLHAAGVRVHPPEGGFYLFLDFENFREKLKQKGIKNAGELCDKMLTDTGVAMLPGTAFGRENNELTARIAYVDFDGALALTASETTPLDHPLPDDFTELWCLKVIAAVKLINDWLSM